MQVGRAVDLWDLLIWGGSAGFVLCLAPQLLHTLRRRRADDISLPFLVLVLAASALTLPYMLHRREFVFASAQAVNLFVWGTVLYFRVFPGSPAS